MSLKAAGEFIDESNWLTKFVASFKLSSSLFTNSGFLTSYAAGAWCTATGTNESNKSLASGLPKRAVKGDGLATAALAIGVSCCSLGILCRHMLFSNKPEMILGYSDLVSM